MAKNFGARKNSKYKVVSSFPSVNKTPRGDSTPDVPYDVQQDLSGADAVSPNVFFNGDPVYVKTSHSTKVTGDEKGSKGGVKSGTVGAQSDPIEASPSVFVNGKAVVRVGDVQYMQNKNTVGKVTTSESGSAAHITDEGKIEGNTQPEPIEMPYAKNKPTNNSGTGTLGARTGSPVLLKNAKLLYRVTDAEFIAPIRFNLQRVYVGDNRKGMFGNGWQCAYETRLIQSNPSTLTLRFPDDQTFRFTYSENGFTDNDDLGAKLTLISPQIFLIEYFSDMHTERYENGYLSEVKDRNGNILNFVREANGKLVRITSSDASLDFEYNTQGYVSRIIDHTARIWNYIYDTQRVQEPLQTKHHLTHVTDPMGGIQHYSYQENSPYLLKQIIDASGVTILEVSYDLEGRVESYRESGELFSYHYETNRVIKTEKVNGEAKDATLGCSIGNKTFYGIDNWGAICAITYPDGSTAREEYHDDTSIVTDQGGNIHVKAFDKRHRLIREITPDKHTILYLYEGDNPFASSIIHNDKTTTYTYDKHHNRTSVTTSDERQERFEYDDRGNVVSHTNREGITTQYAYNANNQRIRISDAMGGIIQYVYDELGNCIAIIDPKERIIQFEYDKLSRRISFTDTDKNTTHFYYDNAGRVSAIRDPLGNMTRYAYDSDGFLSRMINPSDQLRTFTHERGRLTAITREDGERYTFEYDKRGRIISQSIGDKTTLYSYDTLGNLLSVKNKAFGSDDIEYTYDPQANIRLERQGDKSVSHAYNLDGSKRFIGYEGMHFNLMRNTNGVLERIVQGAQYFYYLEFNPQGVQTSLSYPNRIETKSTFDPLGRLTKRTMGETPLVQYTYDKSSRILSKNTTPITYDAGCRVTSAGEESYTYDENGNLLKENTVIDPISGALLEQGDTKFSYDMMGRLIEKNSPTTRTTYEYDVEGYLVRYVRRSNNPVHPERVEVQLHFTYDPLGRRLTKHFKSFVIPNSIGDPVSNLKDGFPIKVGNDILEYHHRYLYSGANIVAIYDNDTDELLATLLHEEDAVDSPLSIHIHPKDALTTEEQRHFDTLSEDEQFLFNQSRIKCYYYHRDHQNSIIALSDENAQIVEYYEYDIYGTITKSEKIAQTLNPYRYTGREYDTDDLYYYRARYYDPTISRFITPDPIGLLSGDTNFYRYVGNDPVNFIDPSGLSGLLALLDEHNPIKDAIEWWNTAPDTSIPKTAIPNSTIPKGKTVAQVSKPKTAQVSSKTAQTNKGDGVKIKGDVKPIVDEKCKDQKWHDPIDNPQLAKYTQGGHMKPWWNVFGEVRKGNSSSNHQGVDLFAIPGTPVYACVDSTVSRAGYTGKGYGNVVVLKAKCPNFVRSRKQAYNLPYAKHGEKIHGINFDEKGDFYFMYAHLSKISTKILEKQKLGEKIEIKAGDMIGEIGTSGYKTSRDPHLHFEILNISHGHKGLNNRVNPGYYVNYKLPHSLQEKESQTQKAVADSKTGDTRQGDPSLKK